MIRIFIAAVVALALALIVTPFFIAQFRRRNLGQQVRDDGPQSHLSKQGTPTMGGILIIGCAVLAVIFCCAGNDFLRFPLIAIITTLGYGAIGFIDDYVKLMKKRSLGLRAWQKVVLQIAFALVLAFWLQALLGTETILPFTGQTWDMGWLYVPFVVFVLLAMTNSANLLDGLDGLLTSVSLLDMVTLAIIAVIFHNAAGQSVDEGFINAGAFSAAVAGSCLGFLFYNRHPAKIFMGDTGSMALGGAVSIAALLMRVPLILPLIAIMMVASSVSDIIQIGSYKLRKKRVFRMAPLHHHFELGGHGEKQIVLGYSIVTLIMCVLSIFAV